MSHTNHVRPCYCKQTPTEVKLDRNKSFKGNLYTPILMSNTPQNGITPYSYYSPLKYQNLDNFI